MSIRMAGKHGFARPPMVKIFSQTLTATGRFDVTGIPQGFKHLAFFTSLRTDQAVAADSINFFLNGDTTAANYKRNLLLAGDSVSASSGDDALFLQATGASATANHFASNSGIIYNYTNGQRKNATSSGIRTDGATVRVFSNVLFWENPAAINQITIQPDGYATDEFVAESSLEIYGLYQ